MFGIVFDAVRVREREGEALRERLEALERSESGLKRNLGISVDWSFYMFGRNMSKQFDGYVSEEQREISDGTFFYSSSRNGHELVVSIEPYALFDKSSGRYKLFYNDGEGCVFSKIVPMWFVNSVFFEPLSHVAWVQKSEYENHVRGCFGDYSSWSFMFSWDNKKVDIHSYWLVPSLYREVLDGMFDTVSKLVFSGVEYSPEFFDTKWRRWRKACIETGQESVSCSRRLKDAVRKHMFLRGKMSN